MGLVPAMLRSGVLSRSSLAFAPRPFACSIRCKQDEVEDIQTKLIREKATRKKYNKKTNQALGRPYNYAWRFPTLRFNKALHDEMRVLIKDQRWDQLNERWTLLRKIGKHPTPHTVEMLVDALAQSQQVDRAPAVIQTLDNDTNRITANTWRHLAAGYLQANQLEQALEAINSLTNEYPDELPHDARTYGSFVSYFMRHGEQENAQAWMKEFQEREQKFVIPAISSPSCKSSPLNCFANEKAILLSCWLPLVSIRAPSMMSSPTDLRLLDVWMMFAVFWKR